jgi:beta-1,4-mannosyltransferase
MKILAIPRDLNPYQDLLYDEMQRLGVRVSYLGELTPSRTLNLILLPLETAARRIAGAHLIHLHWVFAFAFPGAGRFPVLRRAAYIWFVVWLGTCRMLRMPLVWTAHNVVPHQPVFADDVSARRVLVRHATLVLAHSRSTLAELGALGAVARRSAVIQHGPMGRTPPTISLPAFSDGGSRRFLFFGKIQEYKGVDDLLVAFAAVPDNISAHLTVAGQCDDPVLHTRLRELAAASTARVTLRLEYVPENEAAALFGAADVVVLPFRQITTSGSAMLALSCGRPLIVPDLPSLAHLPDEAVLRYNGRVTSLSAALVHLAEVDREVLAGMSAAASRYAFGITWPEIARQTVAEMTSAGSGAQRSRRRPGPTS